jgi:hypothetical protein
MINLEAIREIACIDFPLERTRPLTDAERAACDAATDALRQYVTASNDDLSAATSRLFKALDAASSLLDKHDSNQ